jgi:adenine-specific DNA-methyltransferase
MGLLKFKSKEIASKQKLRGGYYTPVALAEFISQWILTSKVASILEPSFGDGNFLEPVLRQVQKLKRRDVKITAVEIDTDEFIKGVNRVQNLEIGDDVVDFVNNDFFRSYENYKEESFDAVIGNPPYIRFQHFDKESREIAFDHLKRNNYKPSKLANAWSAFTQLAIASLKPGGKLGFVIPAELLQVKYAGSLRERILQSFAKTTIISFKEIVFPGILQEVIILLCEGKSSKLVDGPQIRLIELENGSSLSELKLAEYSFHPVTDSIKDGHKWTSLFVDDQRLKQLWDAGKNVSAPPLGAFAKVNVGIVTGRNKFFVLPKSFVEAQDLYEFVTPLVGKTSAFKKTSFTYSDFEKYADEFPCYLLDLDGISETDFNKNLKKYIELGEDEEVHKGYKCRIRKKWFVVPSVHKSDGFLFRQVYKYPLLVDNSANATCTDTIHRVILRDTSTLSIQQLSTAFVNSLTFAFSELIGRSYGGGVLELEPREALMLPVPIENISQVDPRILNNYLENQEIEKALNYSDNILLKQGIGLSDAQVQQIRSVWHDLRDRRLNRS